MIARIGALNFAVQFCTCKRKFKGTVPQDFQFQFFSWISFPQAPEYPIRTVLNFFKYLRKYSQFKVHHWCRLHWWQIYRRCFWYWGQYATGVIDTGGKFASSMVDNGGKFANVGEQMFFFILKSQIRKFLGSIRNQKSSNFWVHKFQICKFLLIKPQIANPQISWVSSRQIANPLIFHHKTERMKHLIFFPTL